MLIFYIMCNLFVFFFVNIGFIFIFVSKFNVNMKTNRDRFKEIASRRVDKVLSSLSSLEKCSNSYNYEYNQEDVKKMNAVLKTKFGEVKAAFEKGVKKNNEKFKF